MVKVARARRYAKKEEEDDDGGRRTTTGRAREKMASKEGRCRHRRGINISVHKQYEHESASKSIGCATGKVGARKSTAHLSPKHVRPHGRGARKVQTATPRSRWERREQAEDVRNPLSLGCCRLYFGRSNIG